MVLLWIVAAPSRTKAEMQYRATIMVKLIDASQSVVKWAITGTVIALLGHFATESIKALAGKVTISYLVSKFLGSIAINQWVAWVIAGISTGWACLERRQKRKKIAELSRRPIELEKMIDPGRSSSSITPEGTTRPGD